MGPVTWKISEYSTRPGYRPSVPGRKRYVRMGPVEVWISADSVSLMIISFSDLVDGNDLLIARTWDAMASTGRSTNCCPCIASSPAGAVDSAARKDSPPILFRQLRSRFAQRLHIRHGVRFAFSFAAALLGTRRVPRARVGRVRR